MISKSSAKSMTEKTKALALVVAAGRGSRMGGTVPKQYQKLQGESVLTHSLRRLIDSDLFSSVMTVIHSDDQPLYRQSIAPLDNRGVSLLFCPGGQSRQDSVRRGLRAVAQDLSPSDTTAILIHDAARPLVPRSTLVQLVESARAGRAAIAAHPVVDSLKHVDDQGQICESIPRAGLWRAQTPQAFSFAEIMHAHERAADRHDLTDDAAVAQAAGLAVGVILSSDYNIKVTTPDDLSLVQALLPHTGHNQNTGHNQKSRTMETRTGQGYDVHAFEDGNAVVLCGVKIPHTQRLKGHSDADVGLHALTDAIFAALAEGDIGHHFPPSDSQWAGEDSAKFLAHACTRARMRGARLVNVDVTLICEAPHIGPYRDAMRTRIGQITGLSINRISVKATTSERLGFTGRREGIAALALANLECPNPDASNITETA